MRQPVKLHHHPTVYRIGLLHFLLDIEVVEHLADIGVSLDAEASVLQRHDVLGDDHIVFVEDLSYQFFYNILHGHEAFRPAVFVDDDGHMELHLLHLPQKIRNTHRRADEGYRHHIVRQVLACPRQIIMKVLLVDHADDPVDILFIDRQAGKSRPAEDARQLVQRAVHLHRLDLRPRRHDIFSRQMIELNRVFDQLAVFSGNTSAFFCFFHHDHQFILADAFALMELKYFSNQLFPFCEEKVNRC